MTTNKNIFNSTFSNKIFFHPDCVAGKPRKLMGASCESPGDHFLSLISPAVKYFVRKVLLAGIYQYDNK